MPFKVFDLFFFISNTISFVVLCFCRFVTMEHIGLYTGILKSNAPFGQQTSLDLNVATLDDLDFELTQGTQQASHDLPVENEDEVVEVQAAEVAGRRSAKKGASHRSKNLIKMKIKLYAQLG